MSTAENTAARVARTLQESEAARRSGFALFWHSVAACIVAVGALGFWPDPTMRREVACAVLVEWGTFCAAAFLYKRVGRAHALYAAADTLSDTSVSLCVIWLLLRTQAPLSPLWPIALAGGLLFGPRTPEQHVRRRILQGITHAALGAAFLLRGDVAEATFAMVAWSTVDLELLVLNSVFAHQTRARAERDVRRDELNEQLAKQQLRGLSRELHDSVGAEITALIFSLRRAELANDKPVGPSAAEDAQRVLRRLRSAVSELRDLERRGVGPR